MAEIRFPTLPENWEPTRATLHIYANAVGVIPRLHAIAHPKWWHVSLEVRPDGLVTDTMGLPGGGTFHIRMDLRTHEVVIDTSAGVTTSIPMTEGLTGTEFGDMLIAAVAELGLDGEYVRQKFESDGARDYDPTAAKLFFDALVDIDYTLEQHRSSLDGHVGPLQVWPHGFDLAFEWFGTRTEMHGDEELPSQLNLGWYPAGDAYFYSNPWPFDADVLLGVELPHGAVWHTEGWEGTMLPYGAVAGDPEGPRKVLEYARAVFDAAAPTLTA